MTSPYTFEFEDGAVRAWHLTEEGAELTLIEEYRPALFVGGPDDALADLNARLASDPKVCETAFEERYTTLRDTKSSACGETGRSRVLRASLERIGEVRTLAREIRTLHERESHAPGTFRLFDVDLAPGFRYCLDEDIDPTPTRELRTLRIEVDDRRLADRDLSELRIDGEPVRGESADVLWSLARRLDREDPDALVLSHGDLVPALDRAASEEGLSEFRLGRLPGWTRLAGESTYRSYGRVGHSPARYRVPGRAIVDTSNSFLWHQSGLEGLCYMVERSGRPLQEAARASIGTVLTSMQIRVARKKWGVLAPWNKWKPESFKNVSTLHAADRGGSTFAPEVGLHEGVHEIDFASLYPRIICRHNVSPETIDCDCCGPDGARTSRERVPELDYRVCAERGFLPAVLKPLLDDRANIKRRLREDPPGEEAERLRARSGAIKWVLVSCFGYQGYRNAKFGRIECHEAINAYARDTMLRSKARLEDGGWHVVHGIVDSLWVTPRTDDPEPLEAVVGDISHEIGIDLEHDGSYEWACFVPSRGSGGNRDRTTRTETSATLASARSAPAGTRSAPAGALTKYFGKREGGEFKFRGIETRQRSTPAFVADCQREFVEVLDETRDPAAVCDRLARRLGELRRGGVDADDLVVTKRASRPPEAYDRRTHTVAALRRYDRHGIERHPGQSVRYVVADDDARSSERVRLEFEDGGYDVDYYAALLVRAAESVTSPLGWDRERIRRYLADGRTVQLSSFE